PHVVSDVPVNDLKNSGMDAKAALNPLGTVRKSVPAVKKVMRKVIRDELRVEESERGKRKELRLKTWKIIHEMSKPIKPSQRKGPLNNVNAAKTLASVRLFLLMNPSVKIKNVIAKIGLAAWREIATRPGSSAMKKASNRLGRGLRRLSKRSGAKTSK